jgi:hypothetical protein
VVCGFGVAATLGIASGLYPSLRLPAVLAGIIGLYGLVPWSENRYRRKVVAFAGPAGGATEDEAVQIEDGRIRRFFRTLVESIQRLIFFLFLAVWLSVALFGLYSCVAESNNGNEKDNKPGFCEESFLDDGVGLC